MIVRAVKEGNYHLLDYEDASELSHSEETKELSYSSEEIAEIAKSCGAEVPFMRSVELSDDYAGTTEVIAHAVSWMHEQQWQPEAVCCIYATSVFLTVADLKKVDLDLEVLKDVL